MSAKSADQLFEEAQRALLESDTKKATDLLKQLVEIDPERVDAWVELAKVLEDPDEKRIALSSILQLDPENEFAKEALAAAETTKQTQKPKADPNEEVYPGIKRREMRLAVIGLSVFTLVMAFITLSVVNTANSNRTMRATQVAQAYIDQTATLDAQATSQQQVVETQTAFPLSATAEFLLTNTPTPLPTRTPDLPPTYTPTVDVALTPLSFSSDLPKPPPNIPGRVFTWGGPYFQKKDYLPFRQYALSGQGAFTEVNKDFVAYVTVNTAGTLALYHQNVPIATSPLEYVIVQLNLTQLVDVRVLGILFNAQPRMSEPKYPRISADGSKFVIVGLDTETNTSRVYLGDVANQTFVPVTNDQANYSSAAIAPDGVTVVAVRTDVATNATDLVIINTADPALLQTPLTIDGNTLIESQVSFAPSGQAVVYRVNTPDRPEQGDLYIARLNGQQPAGAPQPIMTIDGDDAYPVFSPDSNYVAFSSNRVQNVYNIYIYDIANRQTYQLSAEPDPIYVGGWSN